MMEEESEISSCVFWIFTELSTRNSELLDNETEVKENIRRVIEYYAVRIYHYYHYYHYTL